MAVVPLGVGDFIAISKLIYSIGVEIKKNAKSASDYQSLLIELESLDRALKWLQTIRPAQHELRKLDAIRAVASTCQQPLEDFMAKIEKFEHRLGSFAPRNRSIARTTRGLQWSLKYDEEVKSLRAKLAPNIATITILLLTQTIDTVAIADGDHQAKIQKLDTRLDSQQQTLEQVQQTSSGIARIQDDLKAGQEDFRGAIANQSDTLSDLQSRATELLTRQTAHEERLIQHTEALRGIAENGTAIEADVQDCKAIASSIKKKTEYIEGLVPSILKRVLDLMGVVSAGVRQLQSIATLLSQILSVATQFSRDMMQTMGNLLQAFCDLQRQVASLERWIPKQIDLPIVRFRDAFNDVRIFPFDLSRDWTTFQQLVHATFSNKQGLHRVDMGQYFVTNARNSQRLQPRFWRHAIQPGDELTMTMILDDFEAEDGYCPFRSCGASTVDAPLVNGGKFCGQCQRFATITAKVTNLCKEHNSAHAIIDQLPLSTGDSESSDGSLVQLTAAQNEFLPIYGPHAYELIDEDVELYHSIQVAEALYAQELDKIHGQGQKSSTETTPASKEYENLLLSKIQIFVRNLQGKTKIIRTDPSTTIQSIKENLQVTERIHPSVQRLVFAGKALQNGQTLADYNIHNDNTIHLTSGLHSSAGPPTIDSEEYKIRTGLKIGDTLKCFVRFLTGKVITVRIENDKTVLQLKETIHKSQSIAPDQQRLVYAGGQIQDEIELYRYGIEHSSTLHIVLRLKWKRSPRLRRQREIGRQQREDIDIDAFTADISSLFDHAEPELSHRPQIV